MDPAPSATGSLLWTRAAVLSVVALATGAFAHVQADGLLPGVGALVALVACCTLAGAPFLRWTLAARDGAQSALGIEVPALAVVVLEPRPHSAVRSRSVSRRGPPRAA